MQSNPYEFSPEDLSAFREAEIASLLPFQVKRGPVIYPEPAADATASADTNEPDDVDPGPGEPPTSYTWNVAPPGIVCTGCGRQRTPDDWYDYHPIQAMTGRPLGWYSGDDGQMCGKCLTDLMAGTLRNAGLPATPGRTEL